MNQQKLWRIAFVMLAAFYLASCSHSRGDRHLGYSSRHTQVPVPATTQEKNYF